MSKQDRYTSKDKSGEIEEMSNRLASELRSKIRLLGNHAIFSDAWLSMADICGRIASISDVELSLSASKSEGTLWETEEQALRYLIEDGKLNLCLRSLIDYKNFQFKSLSTGSTHPNHMVEKGDQFEKG